MEKKFTKSVAALATIAALGAGAAVGAVVSADTAVSASVATTPAHPAKPIGARGFGQGVFGKVTAVSGNTLTVSGGKDGTTSYTVDISNAKIMKASGTAAPAAATASSIAVGDQVAIKGAVTGTSVVATQVMDGMPSFGRGKGFDQGKKHAVTGSVTAVNGSTITLTGKDGKTYTIDATKANISKITSITSGDVSIGDTLSVNGAVNGTTVTAANIVDGVRAMHGSN